MHVNCSISNCTSTSRSSTGVSFHKIGRKSHWLRLNPFSWKPHKIKMICSKHFPPDSYNLRANTKCLKQSAMPTLYNFHSIAMTSRQDALMAHDYSTSCDKSIIEDPLLDPRHSSKDGLKDLQADKGMGLI